ncbi:glycosyltransferase family 4 protein [Halovivax cerinus]|uniref:Glycosyltransferase family 4 protein n=1 Tax=Halovivax cerinus TaxID=1487865 RepID=A0ABD5NNL2_9EURY|nr:glycosyltransferase family 4 protein [Halovivax cerinus]
MRICRVAQKVYPDVPGGGPYHVHAMSRDQAARGHDVTVLTVRHDASLPRVEERDGYTIRRFDPTACVLGNDFSLGLARRLADLDDVDVVHAHSHLYASTNVAAIRRSLDDIPLAITNHGLFSQNAPAWAIEGYLRSIGRWTLNRADIVFCYSEVDERRLRSYGVSTPVAVVRNGIDVDRFSPDGPTSDLIDDDGIVVLFVGRLVEGKRPKDAVRTLEYLRRDLNDVTLYVCGDGPLRDDLETAIARRDLVDHVEFLGHVSYDEMPRLYRSSDVLLLPSRAEGMPRTMLEAQASGLPVVSSDLDQLRTIRTSADRFVSDDAGSAFAAGVQSVIETNGHLKTTDEPSSRFSWDRTVEETTTVLERLVTDRHV